MTVSELNRRRPLPVPRIALFFGLLAKSASLALVLILLPPLGRQMGFSDVQTGFVMSVSALAAILTAPVWGWLTERWGRRPVLLVGFFALAATLVCLSAVISARLDALVPVTTGLIALVFGRILQTGFAAAMIPAAQAYMADTTNRSRRAQGMGLLGAAFGIGALLGAALAGSIGGTDPVIAVMAAALIALSGGLLVFLFVVEPNQTAVSKTKIGEGLEYKRLLPNFLATFAGVALFSVLQQTTALRFQDYFGYTPVQSVKAAGGVLAVTSLTMILTQGVVLWMLRWSPAQYVFRAGLLASFAFLGLLFASGYPAILLAMALLGVSLGLLFPGNLASMSLKSSETAQGKVAGVNALFQGLGMATGPLAGAYLNAFSASAVPLVGGLVCLLVTALFWAQNRIEKN